MYLTDLEDTVQFYEEQGKAKYASGQAGTQYDHAMQALSKLDRTAQIEALHGTFLNELMIMLHNVTCVT